jgi:hypothetical protein
MEFFGQIQDCDLRKNCHLLPVNLFLFFAKHVELLSDAAQHNRIMLNHARRRSIGHQEL